MKRRALLSVSDKSGIDTFARSLADLGYEILSTGGTERALAAVGIAVTPVENVTRFPECFGGRVKTMHPAITGGILFRRDHEDDVREALEHGIAPIDIVAVNLYPFEQGLREKILKGVSRTSDDADLIELIDIGGPTLLRSAAKNHAHVTVICDPADYVRVIDELKSSGETSLQLRRELAAKVFERTAAYDGAIAGAMTNGHSSCIALTNGTDLRYGENPHQWGRYFDVQGTRRLWRVLQEEKQMSYLNILDADGAINLVCERAEPTAACIKHANPSGAASAGDIVDAFQRAYDADRLSAFGVIIALNRECPAEIVRRIIDQKIFADVLIAPGFANESLELLRQKPKIRVLECSGTRASSQLSYRSMLGGILMQNEDVATVTADDLTCVTSLKPTDAQTADMLFAWSIVKHAKSNAVVFAKDRTTVGIGCGQTSRVDAVWIAAKRAGDRARGAVMASDAFFPFPDSIEEAAKHGIGAIIQPGGSIRDAEVIAKANDLGITMVTTGVRSFRH